MGLLVLPQIQGRTQVLSIELTVGQPVRHFQATTRTATIGPPAPVDAIHIRIDNLPGGIGGTSKVCSKRLQCLPYVHCRILGQLARSQRVLQL